MELFRSAWSLPLLITLITSCTVGPDYHKPDAPLPSHYIEAKSKYSATKINPNSPRHPELSEGSPCSGESPM